jgi:bifunctional non-homologous end joining protein LigD
VAPYSLRGRDEPTVSAPVTWDEVRACRHVSHLRFTAAEVLERVDDLGDLFAELDRTRVPIPTFG